MSKKTIIILLFSIFIFTSCKSNDSVSRYKEAYKDYVANQNLTPIVLPEVRTELSNTIVAPEYDKSGYKKNYHLYKSKIKIHDINVVPSYFENEESGLFFIATIENIGEAPAKTYPYRFMFLDKNLNFIEYIEEVPWDTKHYLNPGDIAYVFCATTEYEYKEGMVISLDVDYEDTNVQDAIFDTANLKSELILPNVFICSLDIKNNTNIVGRQYLSSAFIIYFDNNDKPIMAVNAPFPKELKKNRKFNINGMSLCVPSDFDESYLDNYVIYATSGEYWR